MNSQNSGHPRHFAAQIFAAGNIPSGDDLDLLYEWGFGEAYMLAVPDIRRYLLDAYAHGVMHSLAKGDYRWADRESVPGAAIDRLLADLLGNANPAGVRYHSWRYVDLLREAWRLGAGQPSRISRSDWRRWQAVADAYFHEERLCRPGSDVPKEGDLGRAVSEAYSAWGGATIPGPLLARFAAKAITAEDWSEASEDLRDHNLGQDVGKLIRLLALAYDLGHPAGPGSADATEVPAPPHA